MERNVYIDGNVLVKSGIFYARNFTCYASADSKEGAEIIKCNNDIFEVKEDYGSIFTNYYVRGDFTLLDGDGIFFKYTHEDTYCQYKKNIDVIKAMLEVTFPKDLENLFFQQQYISVIGALELFLYNTLMRCACDNKSIYNRILSNRLGILVSKSADDDLKVLRGKDCLEKEKLFIKKVQGIVYHNKKKVTPLFKTAFGIDPCLGQLKSEILTRHDLVHRMGYTVDNELVEINVKMIIMLIEKTDSIVENIASHIKELNSKTFVPL